MDEDTIYLGIDWGGTKIEIRDYDLLVEKSSAFIERARRIVAAFRTALAELDPLTGVYNRQRMLSELERERELIG